jgi:hypothetical protein
LTGEVERLAAADPKGYVEHPKAKLLKRIVDLIESEIPEPRRRGSAFCECCELARS